MNVSYLWHSGYCCNLLFYKYFVPLALLPNWIAVAPEGLNIYRKREYVKGIVRETRLFMGKTLSRTERHRPSKMRDFDFDILQIFIESFK